MFLSKLSFRVMYSLKYGYWRLLWVQQVWKLWNGRIVFAIYGRRVYLSLRILILWSRLGISIQVLLQLDFLTLLYLNSTRCFIQSGS